MLVDFAAAQESRRRHQAATREQARGMSEFRRISGAGRMGRALDAALRTLPPPAFGHVSGLPAHGARQAERGFVSGNTDRLTAAWLAINSGINADLAAALPALRARSRDWTVNTDTGARYLELVADNIVGHEAPRLQVRVLKADGNTLDEALNSAVEAAFAAWCGQCDVGGRLDFGMMCRAVVQGTAREGEYLVRKLRDRAHKHGLALQLLDVDRIDTALNVQPQVPGGLAVRLGVEINAVGRAQALYLTSYHPGDYDAGPAPRAVRDRVPMDQLLHGFVPYRPEQVRGYPWTAPVLREAHMQHQYKEFAMVAARVGAAKMGFYTVDKELLDNPLTLDQLKDATGNLMQDVEAGMLEALPPGVGFESFNPDYPHQNYASFTTVGKRDLAAGLSVAHHNLSGDMTGVNYSSARIAELAERRHWKALQRWLVNSFVRPVFADWLLTALSGKHIKVPGVAWDELRARYEDILAAASFQPPSWAWMDPESDIKGSAIAATYDMRSLRQIADENGVDLDDVLNDKQRLRDAYVARNLPVPPWLGGGAPMTVNGGNTKPAGTPAPAPAPATEAT